MKKSPKNNSELLTPSSPNQTEVNGDGGGVFLGEMNEEEMLEYERNVDKGWGGFYKKVKQLGKSQVR